MFDKIFSSGPKPVSDTIKQDAPLAHKGVEDVKGVFDYQMSGNDGGPLYFALLSGEDTVVVSPTVIENAKNQLQEIYAHFPGEVKALNGASLAETTAKLSELKNKIATESHPMAA
jgi:hypothetical protein